MEKYLDNHYRAILSQIREGLAQRQVTQSDLGKALGINQSSVSALLNGTSMLSLVQFLKIAEILGTTINQIVSNAERSLVKRTEMTEPVEKILYKSPAHLLGYCAATKPIQPKDLMVDEISEKEAITALHELKSVGVLAEQKGRYTQSETATNLIARSRARSSEAHRKVANISWKIWNKFLDRTEYRQKKFNFYLLDRFTLSQIKEIEAACWQVHEKAIQFQKENMVRNYEGEISELPLWNIHVMLMTPLETK